MALGVEVTKQITAAGNAVWISSLCIAWTVGVCGRAKLTDAQRINAFVPPRTHNVRWITVFLLGLILQRLYWLLAGAMAPIGEHYADWANEWRWLTFVFVGAHSLAALALADVFALRAFGATWRIWAGGLLVCAAAAPFLFGVAE